MTDATEAADVSRIAASVARAGGPSVAALVFFGSRKTGARTDEHSAYDFFLVAHDYSSLYRSLEAAGSVHRPAWLLAGVNAVLPPNVISIRPSSGAPGSWRAKCAVATLDRFERETSAARHDHFFLGRLFQPAEIVHAADEATRQRVAASLVGARNLTYAWARPWLPASFDVDDYCRTLLRVSLAREIRPEPTGRADALWEVQKAELRPLYGRLLGELARAGELVDRGGGVYSLARPVTSAERFDLAVYFRWSMVRATARWAKYMVTFDDWLEYILRKARRHSGQDIVLTPRERRLPLVFLWPRVIRYLRDKDRQGRGA